MWFHHTVHSFFQLESRQQYTSQQVGLLAVSVGCVGRKGFSVPQIAELFGVSVRTVLRTMSEIGTDQELDRHVREIQLNFPKCGNRQMYGHLGFRLQQYHVTEATIFP